MYLMQAGEKERTAVEKLVKEAQTQVWTYVSFLSLSKLKFVQIPNLEEGIATAVLLSNQLDKSAAETTREIVNEIEVRHHLFVTQS